MRRQRTADLADQLGKAFSLTDDIVMPPGALLGDRMQVGSHKGRWRNGIDVQIRLFDFGQDFRPGQLRHFSSVGVIFLRAVSARMIGGVGNQDENGLGLGPKRKATGQQHGIERVLRDIPPAGRA